MTTNNLHFSDENNLSTVDEILRLDDEENREAEDHHSNVFPLTSDLVEDDKDDTEPTTKHTVVTSPWSRLGMVGIPLGGGFLVFFMLFNSIINGGNQAKKEEAKTVNQPTEQALSENDGDVYAQLALAKQAQELDKIDSQKNKSQVQKTEKPALPSPEVPVSRQSVAVASSPPPPPRYVQRNYSPPPRAIAASPRNYSVTRPQPIATVKPAADPISELNRLRSLGSFGKINYASNVTDLNNDTLSKNQIGSGYRQPVKSQKISAGSEIKEPLFPGSNSIETPNDGIEIPGYGIEKIRPRWSKIQKSAELIAATDNASANNSITTNRYLVVGQFADGVLMTPLVKEQSTEQNSSIRQSDSNSSRYLAKLTQDLYDNYGDVAISRGTLVAVSVISVDGASYAKAQVTSIIKDNTEYPIAKDAISLLGEGGNPLVAKPFKDKGGELAGQDLTVGLVSGVGKVGEIINQSDSSSSVINSAAGTFSTNVTSNTRRNIGGAFLQGAFGKLGEIIEQRSQTSTQEILSRPNIWYIPKGTKITFMVNRTLELP
ncbi:TrbI/VirB10 family protein [Komarekiella sp. 'clone 1']|uniref:TrbI/VirB10 family protein n=1 Tax=Komarekiella delphini-convector SJRDD-AB1 TaxID=2593771 RepID=A0AA40T3M0_9NOST|nr:TrbI/VirB10 family protein [Komarekiella delphini-convector]MBD6620336.1 TrbI/VirB10 family protein [Komarekiella delphini-convector SJRDD-AB1]